MLLFDFVMPIIWLVIRRGLVELWHQFQFFARHQDRIQQFYQYLIDFERWHLLLKWWAWWLFVVQPKVYRSLDIINCITITIDSSEEFLLKSHWLKSRVDFEGLIGLDFDIFVVDSGFRLLIGYFFLLIFWEHWE